MDEYWEFWPLDMQITKERDDWPDMKLESALVEEASLKIIENRTLTMYKRTFSRIYNDGDIKINKKDLSKQVFDFCGKLYEPLLRQINPYSLWEKQRKLDLWQDYATYILKTLTKFPVFFL